MLFFRCIYRVTIIFLLHIILLFRAFHGFWCIRRHRSMSSSPRWSHRSHHQSSSPDTWHMAHLIGSLVRYGGHHRRPPLRPRRRLCRFLCRWWQRSWYDSIIVAPAAASLSSSSSSMTKTIRIHSFCAFSGVFVVRSVVDNDERYEFITFAPSAASFSFAPSLMTTKDTNSFNLSPQRRLCCLLCRRWRRMMRLNHVGNQHGLPFIGLLQSSNQPQSLLIAWL